MHQEGIRTTLARKFELPWDSAPTVKTRTTGSSPLKSVHFVQNVSGVFPLWESKDINMENNNRKAGWWLRKMQPTNQVLHVVKIAVILVWDNYDNIGNLRAKYPHYHCESFVKSPGEFHTVLTSEEENIAIPCCHKQGRDMQGLSHSVHILYVYINNIQLNQGHKYLYTSMNMALSKWLFQSVSEETE